MNVKTASDSTTSARGKWCKGYTGMQGVVATTMSTECFDVVCAICSALFFPFVILFPLSDATRDFV